MEFVVLVFPLLALVLLGITYWRNEAVYNYRAKLLDRAGELNLKEINNGVYSNPKTRSKWNDFMWRFEVINEVSYNEMVWKFWKPLDSFYKDAIEKGLLTERKPEK